MVETQGSRTWRKVADRMQGRSKIIQQACEIVSKLAEQGETERETWIYGPILGNSMTDALFPITNRDKEQLRQNRLKTVAQLFEQNERGKLEKRFNTQIEEMMREDQMLLYKLRRMQKGIERKVEWTEEAAMKGHTEITGLKIFFEEGGKLSQKYSKEIRRRIDEEIGEPPSYRTRIRDRINVPDRETYSKGYKIVRDKDIPSKTKEISFQILNRTLWTKNKAFKAGMGEEDTCRFCGEETETIEHLIINCDKYSYKQWKLLEEIIGKSLVGNAGEPGTMTLNYVNIIYNKRPKITGAYERDKTIGQTIQLIIQELKRDIYYRAQNQTGEINNFQRYAHMRTLIRKMKSYLEYKGEGWEKNVQSLLKNAEEKIEQKIQAESDD